MRVLITGVAGHVGSSLARWICEHHPGAEIFGIDDLSCGYRENVPAGVEWEHLDLSELRLMNAAPFDAVFHFAAYAAECLSPFIRRYNYQSNLLATASLLNALLAGGGCGRLVFASSIAVYGPQEPPFEEKAVPQPHDPYGVAKLACEHDLRIAGEQHGLDWCIVRPHNIYGPGQSLWQKYRNVFGLWMRAALEGKPFTIFGDGLQRRAFSYIDDILPCLWQAAVAPQASRQTINLGGSEPIEIHKAADTLAFVMGSEGAQRRRYDVPSSRLQYVPARHEVRDAWCSTTKSRELLGYADRTALHVGLEAMWHWALQAWREFPERRAWQEPFAIELSRGLPESWQTYRRASMNSL